VTVRVFVVEDLQTMRALLMEVFASDERFHAVGAAGSEGEAKIWLEEHTAAWDLVVVDLMLSEGSGFGVVGRARQTHPTGCIAVLSSYLSDAVEKHCLKLGADVVFDKAQTLEFLNWLQRVADAEGTGKGSSQGNVTERNQGTSAGGGTPPRNEPRTADGAPGSIGGSPEP
jgi:two-component system, OmpR family, response regulator